MSEEKKPRVEKELLEDEIPSVDSQKIFKVMAEFVNGFEIIKKYGKAATFFGSARSSEDNGYYKQAEDLSSKLAKEGYTIITGGGGGIMKAANKGAKEVGGNSVGLNVNLPHEQKLNLYVNDSEDFDYFFIRKIMLSYASEVYVYFPGGFGTLDEFFELVMLIQTKKIKRVPIVMIGEDYWKPLLEWIEKKVYKKCGNINKEDMEIYNLCSSVDEAFELIKELAPEDVK